MINATMILRIIKCLPKKTKQTRYKFIKFTDDRQLSSILQWKEKNCESHTEE